MPNPNAIVSLRIRLDPALDRDPEEILKSEGGLSIVLDDDRRLRLNPDDPRAPGFARALDGIARAGRPAYLVVDPATETITDVRLPKITRILRADPAEDGLEVELQGSQARHLVRAGGPDAAEFEGRIREALVSRVPLLVTGDDAHDVIDVRPFTPGPDGPLLPFPEPPTPFPPPAFPPLPKLPPWLWWPISILWWVLLRLKWWICYPWWWWRCPSTSRSQVIFDAMAVRVCNPLTVPAPCIPFNYPDDGCWGRAHEMARLILDMGVTPGKVWIDKSGPLLHVSTKNNPNCYVEWFWHVAPTICVRSGWFTTQRMVIDPALFTTPVSESTWKGVQNNPNATLTETAWTAFAHGSYAPDPTFALTNQVLADYRIELQIRSTTVGPPPYANC